MDNRLWGLCFLDEGVALSVISRKETRCQWLSDEDHAREYLLSDYLDHVAELGELDKEQTSAARERFELLMEQYPEPETLVEYLNDLTSGLTRILWFGPLSALAEDYGDFALALRAYYWEEYGEGEEDPVTPVVEDDWIYLVEAMDDFLLQDDY
ncbi:hypothetical protein [Oceanisphaera arctica]|uniref:Uncharacterized protein n=1 Tax=Oceanisphaera arctica TaxID=641510 RepID=A0A2P5TLT2_9GAMM|nr:hypothetical protein [Oceanisphaera arctica]PPL16302.1 hypothetical protein UN63_09545 [Oceanisphaera arctica]GHA28788.1 hypothetical protein GCM10007082_31160 [Oceanisphaera arctica]